MEGCGGQTAGCSCAPVQAVDRPAAVRAAAEHTAGMAVAGQDACVLLLLAFPCNMCQHTPNGCGCPVGRRERWNLCAS